MGILTVVNYPVSGTGRTGDEKWKSENRSWYL
jgi:hypothetical protein